MSQAGRKDRKEQKEQKRTKKNRKEQKRTEKNRQSSFLDQGKNTQHIIWLPRSAIDRERTPNLLFGCSLSIISEKGIFCQACYPPSFALRTKWSLKIHFANRYRMCDDFRLLVERHHTSTSYILQEQPFCMTSAGTKAYRWWRLRGCIGFAFALVQYSSGAYSCIQSYQSPAHMYVPVFYQLWYVTSSRSVNVLCPLSQIECIRLRTYCYLRICSLEA
jgi:hypothetical protein